MDICDAAESNIQMLDKAARSHINTKKEAPFTGNCLWCEAPTSNGKRWCSIECRDAWDKFNQVRRNNATITGTEG